jgi:hypothetical protein
VIAVFGAYGHTGRFVVAELVRRGFTPLLSGRDEARLRDLAAAHGGLEVRPATIDDAGALDRAIAGAAVVINCAGPFAETAPAVLDAALRARVHYLDVTGETVVAMPTFERASRGPVADRVRDAGIVVAPAFGFYGALGDLLATAAMGDWTSADRLALAYALDSWKPTRGTRLAGQRRAGRRVLFQRGELSVLPAAAPPRGTWEFPAPFGHQDVIGEFSSVDVVTASRHLGVPEIATYLNTAPLADLADPDTRGPEAADASGRSAQRFLVEAVVRRGGEERRAHAHGRDIYAITAPLVVEAIARIVAGRCTATGAISAGQAFDARDFLTALTPDHLTLALA